MGLHDRIAKNGDAQGAAEGAGAAPRVDPYAELKARVHHACIAKLGPELFKQDETAELAQRDQAQRQLGQAEQQLANLEAASKPTEITQAEANLADARATLTRSEADLKRGEALLRDALLGSDPTDPADPAGAPALSSPTPAERSPSPAPAPRHR